MDNLHSCVWMTLGAGIDRKVELLVLDAGGTSDRARCG